MPPVEAMRADEANYFPACDRADIALAILEAHPDAAVASADESGLFIPLAEGLADSGRPVLEGRGAIELIAAGDRVAMLRAWESCQRTGSGRVVTELLSGEQGTFHFIDLRERFGTRLVLLVRPP